MKKLIQGNQAIFLGAKKAGMSFYGGYPITPASEILEYAAEENAGNKNFKFIQAEDEIASINLCLGASLARVKAMTATSGPGFSLMQESIGYAHMAEIPMVIVDVQRVGPSTGMPTLASQQDVLQTRYGAHGDFYPIVFYPNSVEECYKYTIEAFNAAEESLSPVILLSDGYISHLYETVDINKINIKVKNRTRKPLGQLNGMHFTGLVHDENGNLKTLDSEFYKKWINKIKKKINDTAKKYNFYEYIKCNQADTLLIGYGITSRALMSFKNDYSIFRPIRMFPVIEQLKEISKKYKRIVVVEMNDGQYKMALESFLGRKMEGINFFGGNISEREIDSCLHPKGTSFGARRNVKK
jgi:2-oxoglutarate/2-oxoacid ferredoxin oxidoreductase subunit alpha